MAWKRLLREIPVHIASRLLPREPDIPARPSGIFVLRNNDIGDLLIITPLFEALRKRFPESRIVAGVGDWNREVLQGNPYVDQVVPVNAPWFNHQVQPQRTVDRCRYLLTSPEPRAVAKTGCELGIDVFGSAYGALFLMRAGIIHRVGVRGYRGGDAGLTQSVPYDEDLHVGQSALRLAELLGADRLPEPRPQIYLSPEETSAAEGRWQSASRGGALRVLIGPGAGEVAKRWPERHYVELAAALMGTGRIAVGWVGGKGDRELVARIRTNLPKGTADADFTGQLGLRETFGVAAASDLVICNGSMLMHAAAAFRKRTMVLLSECFPSASHHQRQWGYPETCRSLGLDADRTQIYSASEAFAEARDWLGIEDG